MDDPTTESELTNKILGENLNRFIANNLPEVYERSARNLEELIIEKPRFKEMIQKIRSKISLTEEDIKDGLCSNSDTSKLVERLSRSNGLTKATTSRKLDELLAGAAVLMQKELNLDPAWHAQIYTYILTGKLPTYKVAKLKHMKVIDLDIANGRISLQLEQGLTRSEYLEAWKVFEGILSPSLRLKKATSRENIAMYKDYKQGMKQQDIAKKHYPNLDDDIALNRVKKNLHQIKKELGEL